MSYGVVPLIERIHLAIVQEVVRKGSLTAAAETLHFTQSALSHRIRHIEEQIGTPLWQRDGRRLRLTQAGQYLLDLANRVLPQFALAEERLRQFARGERGTLRIGMECHPCYRWLLKVVEPYLEGWPDVDLDVLQKFQFGGLGALINHEIDLLVTPDPMFMPMVHFEPVFDFEQVLIVCGGHPLADMEYVVPEQLVNEVLLTYPVRPDRLDIFNLFLQPAGIKPKQHKCIETTDILLQMVMAGRGVAALPRWIVDEYAKNMNIVPVRLGKEGIAKQIFLGIRKADDDVDYIAAFIEMAQRQQFGGNVVGENIVHRS